MSPPTLADNRFSVVTTESNERMNEVEQVVVFIVVGLAMVLFFAIFVVFVCRCSQRCPTYRYSASLFQHSPCGVSSTAPASYISVPQSTRTLSLNKRTTERCPHLPPYTAQLTGPNSRPRTPPPEYASVCEPAPLSRPPSYKSLGDKDSENS